MIHQCLIHKTDIALPLELPNLVGRFFLMSQECYFVKMMYSGVSLFKCTNILKLFFFFLKEIFQDNNQIQNTSRQILEMFEMFYILYSPLKIPSITCQLSSSKVKLLPFKFHAPKTVTGII